MMNPVKPQLFPSFAEGLDPNYSYMIFEKRAAESDKQAFLSVLEVLNGLTKKILDHEVYLDRAKVKLLLVVKMEASQDATIMKEVIETGMVGETTCYFYGASREAKGKVVNPV